MHLSQPGERIVYANPLGKIKWMWWRAWGRRIGLSQLCPVPTEMGGWSITSAVGRNMPREHPASLLPQGMGPAPTKPKSGERIAVGRSELFGDFS